MTIRKSLLVGICLALGFTSGARADGWEVRQQSNTTDVRLIYNDNSQTSYLFECSPTEVILTGVGVTDLRDIQTNMKIGDMPGSTMTTAAALMALATDTNSAIDLRPADTAPNALHGWDMTLRFSKKDKALRALRKAKMVSVVTSGNTMAVFLDDSDKHSVRSFLSQCGVEI